MNTPPPPLADTDLDRLQTLLDAVPAPLEPLDASALDGFLAGVVLQPQTVPPTQWLRWVTDVEGRPAPQTLNGAAIDELHALVRRRHAEIEQAIGDRDWFDPWVFPLEDEDAPPQEIMLPWVAGFAAAMDAFPALMNSPDPALIEPLALLYLHFDADDLEDADALLAVIETLEPPTDLAEAVQDLVRALMLMADVTRPLEPVKKPVKTPVKQSLRPPAKKGARATSPAAKKSAGGLHPRGGRRT
jgi:uncharacterized protein